MQSDQNTLLSSDNVPRIILDPNLPLKEHVPAWPTTTHYLDVQEVRITG